MGAEKDALTPAQLKVIQDKLPKSSPYNKGKSPFKKDKLSKKAKSKNSNKGPAPA